MTTNLLTGFVVRLQVLVAGMRDSDRGATAVEYGLMVTLIAVVIIAAVTLIGTNLSDKFNYVATKIGAIATP